LTEAFDSRPSDDPFVRSYLARLKKRGMMQGYSEAILIVLYARDLDVTDAEHACIVTCTTLKHLRTWVTRAVAVEKASDLFGPIRGSGAIAQERCHGSPHSRT
jgi:hypothetical protein